MGSEVECESMLKCCVIAPISMALQFFFWCPHDLLNLDPSPSVEPMQARIKTGTFEPRPTPLGSICSMCTCAQAWENAHKHWSARYAHMTCTYDMHACRVYPLSVYHPNWLSTYEHMPAHGCAWLRHTCTLVPHLHRPRPCPSMAMHACAFPHHAPALV